MDFINYLNKGTTPYQVVETTKNILSKEGFTELELSKPFDSVRGGRYYINMFNTALCCISIGAEAGEGEPLHIAAAHTDHPCLHIKSVAEFPQGAKNGSYMRLNTEVYGGPILNTWLDRPLSIAGAVVVRGNDPYKPQVKLVDFKRPVCIIPNLAIHYNREVNKGIELTKQNDLLPVLGVFNDQINKNDYLLSAIAEEFGICKEDILECDLYVYNPEEAMEIGLNNDMISSPRLDNLTSCFALTKGIISGKRKEGINFAVLFDHEEIGSRTKTGADSKTLTLIIEKIYDSLGWDRMYINDAILSGFNFSVDVAHATHPAHPEKFDDVNRMGINEGITLKISSNQRYTFDAMAIATAEELCKKAGIGYKKFLNRSDIPGGGTLGPMISSLLPMHTVDIGVPIHSMHSARELMGACDEDALVKLMEVFFN